MASKVVWREGMFLRPHHFQQHERHIKGEINNRCEQLGLYPWGFSCLEINEANLSIGELSLNAVAGTFPDGTSFDTRKGDSLPPAIKVEESITDARVYLAIPLSVTGGSEVGDSDHLSSLVRYLPTVEEISDVATKDSSQADIELGELRVRLFIEQSGSSELRVPDGYVRLAIAHIEEVSQGKVLLRKDFIPAALAISAAEYLLDFIAELQGMLSARIHELAGRASDRGGRGGFGDTADFMLLQALNRFAPKLSLYGQTPDFHPYELYRELISFAGELATFFTNAKRSEEFPAYIHEDLIQSFAPVALQLRRGFGTVSKQIAISIPLSPPQYGIRAARINDRSLINGADFIFAVSAEVQQEKLRTQFPAQVKIGPVEKIRELIASALPGISIEALGVAPREIPYLSGFIYFKLDTKDPNWQQLESSGGLAFHIGGEFPGLECQFYAIRRN